ncbi:hypothetical protein ACQ4PT_047453 [Festuca glaucescens]
MVPEYYSSFLGYCISYIRTGGAYLCYNSGILFRMSLQIHLKYEYLWEKMLDPGVQSRADIPDHLLEAVDRHISDMFPGEMHNDLCSNLKGMWKTFFTSSMNRMGHSLVDQMRQMVSVLSIELKNQPCTCKGKQPETENVVAQSSLRMFEGNDEGGCSTYKKENNDDKLSIARKDDVNADIDSDDSIELSYEEKVPKVPLFEMLFTDVLQAPKNDIEGNEIILEVGGKSVSWHNFYVAMKGGGFMDPSVMDVFLKVQCDCIDCLYVSSSLAKKLDVAEDDPIVLASYFSDHDVSMLNLRRRKLEQDRIRMEEKNSAVNEKIEEYRRIKSCSGAMPNGAANFSTKLSLQGSLLDICLEEIPRPFVAWIVSNYITSKRMFVFNNGFEFSFNALCVHKGALCGCLVVPLMTYLDYLDIKVKEVASVVPRISVWDSETVSQFEKLDLVSAEDGTYGNIPAVDDLKEIQQGLYLEIFSAIQPVINNKIANVLQLASHYNEQRFCASEDKQGGSYSRPWFSNMANCLGILNDFDHIYRSNGMEDSPSVMRTESNQEGSVWKDQTHSLSKSQNRNQEVATNAKMSDDMWREQIMPISQNVYKQIRLLQQLIPINCKYTPNALYKEYLLNLEAYLDRVVEDLPSKLPSEGAIDLLVQKGVVCNCCGLLNSPLSCETCKCSVAGDTDKNNAVETRLNISPGMLLKLPDNVRKIDAAVAKEDVPAKIEGDFPESSSKGSGSAVYGSGATMKISADSSINPIPCPDEHDKVSPSNNPVIGSEGSCHMILDEDHSLRLPSSKRNSSESLAVQHDSSAKKQKMSRAFRELGADPNALKNYIIEPNVPCRIYNFDVVMLPVREDHFWIVVVANFMQPRFETYCPYYDATAAENIAMIVIDNFKKSYTAGYYSERYNIYNFQIMPAQIISDNINENDSGPHAMKVILQHSGGFQHKIRENDVKKLREQLTFYMLAFQEAGRDKTRFIMESGEASKKRKVEQATDVGKTAFRSNLSTSRITREMLGIDVGSVDTLAEAIIVQCTLFASTFIVAAGLHKFLGHIKFLVVDNYVSGSVLVKFQDASDLQKVDGLVFRSGIAGPFVVRKVNYVQAQPNDYAELFVLSVSKSNF